MTRVTNASTVRKKRKKLLKLAKGFVGDRKNHPRLTKDCVMTAQSNNYIHRKQKKRNFRALWIVRIGIAAKICGLSYSRLIQGLQKANVLVDRKMLADLAMHDIAAFQEIASKAKLSLAS